MVTICSGLRYCVALLRLTIYTAQNEVMKPIHSTGVIYGKYGFMLLQNRLQTLEGPWFRIREYLHKLSLYRVTNSVGHVSTSLLALLSSISL